MSINAKLIPKAERKIAGYTSSRGYSSDPLGIQQDAIFNNDTLLGRELPSKSPYRLQRISSFADFPKSFFFLGAFLVSVLREMLGLESTLSETVRLCSIY
ncbi:hypothetical protein AVEN_138428-1 [Araneus ventricosus]|uniref:Uncharacterized protein n=1 Tax=Araneus ventricosus TaxID=182803 RepID=A0A4Y2LIE6_ARAVE|nr:hypothetical protein AVEN_138428-1 [Araneus ventricosus]